MPDYQPGVVHTVAGDGTLPAVLVGSGSIWSDDNDATYALMKGLTDGQPSAARGPFTASQFEAVASRVASATLRIKVSGIVNGPVSAIFVGWYTLPLGSGAYVNSAYIPLVSGWNEIGPVFDTVSLGASTLHELCTGPSVLQVQGPPAFDAFFRVTEASIRLTLDADAPAPKRKQDTKHQPPLRQVQRGDGLGVGGVPRAVQRKTRQSSLRRGNPTS